ncbi:hypothetical protein KIPB_015593, partial [Kipferlia bialata]|eukprot:g15593.t1
MLLFDTIGVTAGLIGLNPELTRLTMRTFDRAFSASVTPPSVDDSGPMRFDFPFRGAVMPVPIPVLTAADAAKMKLEVSVYGVF